MAKRSPLARLIGWNNCANLNAQKLKCAHLPCNRKAHSLRLFFCLRKFIFVNLYYYYFSFRSFSPFLVHQSFQCTMKTIFNIRYYICVLFKNGIPWLKKSSMRGWNCQVDFFSLPKKLYSSDVPFNS